MRPVVKNSCSAYYRCMTHDIYIVKTRTNKQKQTDVLLYVNDGCGLNNCYSIKQNKQQEKYCVSRVKICTLGGVGKTRIGLDRTKPDYGLDHGSDHRKKVLKKNQIVYKILRNKE